MERLQQLALLNPHQVTRLFLDIPNLDGREKFQRRPVPVFQPPGTSGHSADGPDVRPKKLTRPICLAQREGLQNDGSVSRAGMNCRRADSGSSIHALINQQRANANSNFYHTHAQFAILAQRSAKYFSQVRGKCGKNLKSASCTNSC